MCRRAISHANRETSAIDGYRGRQLLELLQNADDAAEAVASTRLLVEIRDECVVVANSGSAFSLDGLESDSHVKVLTLDTLRGLLW